MARMETVGQEIQQRIAAVERMRLDAMVSGDFAFLESIFSDDLVYAHSSGKVDTKRQLIDMMKDDSLKYIKIDFDLDRYLNIGVDTYVTSGWLTTEAIFREQRKSLGGRYMSVWRVSSGSIELLALQGSNA